MPDSTELEVSMWRLTDKQKVWYEWCAEAFLPVPGSTPTRPSSPSLSRVGLGIKSSLSIDSESVMSVASRVKIGQTTLHNPSGRSSWVGL